MSKLPQKLAVMAALSAGSLLAGFTPAPSLAQSTDSPTLGCNPGFYQVISGQFAEFSPGTGEYTTLGPDYNNYNAMGYRVADGYMYGVSGNNLIRVDGEGTRTVVGTLPGGTGSYTGDFGDDGLLHVSRGGRSWHKVDVDTLEATPVPEFDDYTAVADITNVHGKFYGVSSDGMLYVYDPVNLTVTEGGMVENLPEVLKAYGAAWATAGGNLYVGRNSGEIYQITGYSKGSPVATRVGSAPATNSNDGGACSLAVVPAGLDDVDGPYSETPPSTPEAEAAAEYYEENYEEISETFTPAEESTVEQQEPPQDPEPVEVAQTEEETTKPDDAGIGQGAGCESNVREDRPERVTVDDLVTVNEATVLYNADFGSASGVINDFSLLSGNWNLEDGALNQLNTCGFDYTALLKSEPVGTFRWESTFSAISGLNHGGIVFNQSSPRTRSGAMVVDLAGDGGSLRWGTYDNAGYYQNTGSVSVTAPATGEKVVMAVEVDNQVVSIFFNGEKVAEANAQNVGGYVGLVASETDIAFHTATLTALPSASNS